jgi:CheY-like chemotaxis protein
MVAPMPEAPMPEAPVMVAPMPEALMPVAPATVAPIPVAPMPEDPLRVPTLPVEQASPENTDIQIRQPNWRRPDAGQELNGDVSNALDVTPLETPAGPSFSTLEGVGDEAFPGLEQANDLISAPQSNGTPLVGTHRPASLIGAQSEPDKPHDSTEEIQIGLTLSDPELNSFEEQTFEEPLTPSVLDSKEEGWHGDFLFDESKGLSPGKNIVENETELASLSELYSDEEGVGTNSFDVEETAPLETFPEDAADRSLESERQRQASVRESVQENTSGPGVEADLSSKTLDSLEVQDRAALTLVRRGMATLEQVSKASEEKRVRGGRVVEILVADGIAQDESVADAFAEEVMKPRMSEEMLMQRLPDSALLQRLPQSYALGRRLLPLELQSSGVLVVVVADPFDQESQQELKDTFNIDYLQIHVTSCKTITRGITQAYAGQAGDANQLLEADTVMLCLVDEEMVTRVGARLVQEGMSVEYAASADTGRQLIVQKQPDAVLCDISYCMDTRDSLLRFMRQDQMQEDIPFFVVAGLGDEENASDMFDWGADDVFETPINLNVLVKKLTRALKKMKAIPKPVESFRSPEPAPFNDPFAGPVDSANQGEGSSFGAVLERPTIEPTGVMGTLRQMSVPEIVQNLEMAKKTARVELIPQSGFPGTFSFDEGRMVYADTEDPLVGEEAFFALAGHKEGFFRIHYGDKPDTENISRPTTFVLLEAMRRIDELASDQPG